MVIRKAEIEDAEAFWQMQNQIDHETDYMLYEPGERKKEIQYTENMIKQALIGNNYLLVAVEEGKLVGYLSAARGGLRKIKHTAHIVIGIQKEYRQKGIGTEFFGRLLAWAYENNLKRLELSVMCPNTIARNLYEKYGFEIEGVKKNAIFQNGEYIDEYYMAKLL